MTIWLPDLSPYTGPKYRALADAIGNAVTSGDLPAGERLPTHRDLAWRLGVTVGTVSRAYALAQSKGWIGGEVGRGTYVRTEHGFPGQEGADSAVADHFGLDRDAGRGPIRMNQSFSSSRDVNEMLAAAMRRLATPERLATIGGYLPSNGLARHRKAGLKWLRQFGIERDEETVLVVNGCQHGLAVSFLALTEPGDTILVEALSWPGSILLAKQLGRRILPVAIDEHGILPDAFEAACRETNPRLLYTIPTIHNPTTTVMPEDRRRAIAKIAGAHDVHIIEDDVFGFLVEDSPPPIARFAPEFAVYVTGLSKPVAPALRTGYVCAPPNVVSRIAAAIRTTTLMSPGLGAELAADLIESGEAADTAGRHRREAAARQRMAAEILGYTPRRTHPNATHLWLELPEGWTAAAFAAQAMARGVAITAGDAFTAMQGDMAGQRSVRVCLGAESNRRRIADGLKILSLLLAGPPPADESVI